MLAEVISTHCGRLLRYAFTRFERHSRVLDDDRVDAACFIVSGFSRVHPSRRDAGGNGSRLKRRARSTILHNTDADKRLPH